MDNVLVIVPCGQRKIWDGDPRRGPTPAGEVYTGAPFKINRAYADRFASRWVILSAQYGFIAPEFMIPGPYNVTFKRRDTNPISVAELMEQIEQQRLQDFPSIIGLGGKDYRARMEQAFRPFGCCVAFPFSGLPIGLAMQATKRAIESGKSCP
jgi:hypothetical protein